MEIDLTGLPWWVNVLVLIVGVALLVSASTALWWVIWKVMFGRWYRALVSVVLIGAAVVLGAPGWLWGVVRDGWGENGWITFGVLLLVGAPIAAVLRVVSQAAMSSAPAPDPNRTALEQQAYNFNEDRRAAEIQQRHRSGY